MEGSEVAICNSVGGPGGITLREISPRRTDMYRQMWNLKHETDGQGKQSKQTPRHKLTVARGLGRGGGQNDEGD